MPPEMQTPPSSGFGTAKAHALAHPPPATARVPAESTQSWICTAMANLHGGLLSMGSQVVPDLGHHTENTQPGPTFRARHFKSSQRRLLTAGLSTPGMCSSPSPFSISSPGTGHVELNRIMPVLGGLSKFRMRAS
ncbi:unnamed protein product [Prorocentrum cordatum]|uniref:Uncharacterized protein n=1 Tax=Prorocentrum cordatum TaxID=2364126 RepID=A0ABN9R2P7_9DINO|nr:unnamed protein product [Polarella glacialis]